LGGRALAGIASTGATYKAANLRGIPALELPICVSRFLGSFLPFVRNNESESGKSGDLAVSRRMERYAFRREPYMGKFAEGGKN